MNQSIIKMIPLPLDGALNRLVDKFETEGFGFIRQTINPGQEKSIKVELHPFGIYFPCNILITETGPGCSQVSLSEQAGVASTLGLGGFATEIHRLAEVIIGSL